jgi:hypothetical protein
MGITIEIKIDNERLLKQKTMLNAKLNLIASSINCPKDECSTRYEKEVENM